MNQNFVIAEIDKKLHQLKKYQTLPSGQKPELGVIYLFCQLSKLISTISITVQNQDQLELSIFSVVLKRAELLGKVSSDYLRTDYLLNDPKEQEEKKPNEQQFKETNWKNYFYETTQFTALAIAVAEDTHEPYEILENAPDESYLPEAWLVMLGEAIKEREQQDLTFGSMPRGLNLLIWMFLLMEELGEMAEELIQSLWEYSTAKYILSRIKNIGQSCKETLLDLNLKAPGAEKNRISLKINLTLEPSCTTKMIQLAATAIAVGGNQLKFNQRHTIADSGYGDLRGESPPSITDLSDDQTVELESAILSIVSGIAKLVTVGLDLDESHSMLVQHTADVVAFDLIKLFVNN